MYRIGTFVCASLIATTIAAAQAQWTAQRSTINGSLRGLSVVDSNVVWASGTHGSYLWTRDGGMEWHAGSVPGAERLDFRDVHAVSLDTAYLMAAGTDTGRIYKTTDRGAHWALQYDDTRKGVFLDAIAFFDGKHGLAMGDPMNGRFLVLKTDDGGTHWTQIAASAIPATLPGEAGFAASGTALVTYGTRDAWFATGGGATARVFRTRDGGNSWTVSKAPVAAGNEGSGIFSLAFADANHGVAVGGNYAKPDTAAVTTAYTSDGGVTWTSGTPSGATGYLSGAVYLPGSKGQQLIAVGTEGSATSRDGGKSWSNLSSNPFNVVAADQKTGRVWAAGEGGSIAVLGLATKR